jgi:hypothetical protein
MPLDFILLSYHAAVLVHFFKTSCVDQIFVMLDLGRSQDLELERSGKDRKAATETEARYKHIFRRPGNNFRYLSVNIDT